MRIVYVAGARIPSKAAHSIQVMRMAGAFAEQGHDVTLVVPSVGELDGDVFEFYGVERSFSLVRVPRRRFKGGLLFWALQVALKARRLGPDILYGRQVHACFFAAAIRLPVILEIHSPPTGRIGKRLFARLVSLPTFRRVVTNSGALARILREQFVIPEGRVLAAPNGADDPQDVPGKQLRRNGRLCVGYVGHLYEGRGVELIVDLAQACPWADFHLVGGADEDVVRWRSRANGLMNIVFHGFVAPAAVESYRRGCDVLLAPYQREVLGSRDRDQVEYMSPLKLFEYMASGRAIVCADLPVLHEILSEGETGLFCDPNTPPAWVAALRRLDLDPRLRHSLGARAREAFCHRFTRAARARSVLQDAEK